jgi:hypothetical protein
MLPAGGIFSLNPGPPSRKGSPMQVVRRTKSYAARKATKPMKPLVAAAPAAELVPTGHGIISTGAANAVSAVSQTVPHGPTKTALTGTVEGAQKNTAASVMVAIIRRSFICRPQRLVIDGRYFQLSSALHRGLSAAFNSRRIACPLWVISRQTIGGQNPTLSALVQ